MTKPTPEERQALTEANRRKVDAKATEQLTCMRCGESWPPLVKHPVQCPRCKSPFWDKPRKRDS